MQIDELRALAAEIGDLDPPQYVVERWQERREILRHRIQEDDPRYFLTWPTIRSTMFVGDQPKVRERLEYIREGPDWSRWRDALQEDIFGGAVRMDGDEYWTSGNLVNQGYYVALWERMTGKNIAQVGSKVCEFAGGYGAMVKILRRLGYDGRIDTYDLPEVALLQQYYLANLGFEGIRSLHAPQIETFLRAMRNGGLFVSVCGLSEIPPRLRTRFLTRLKADSYLIIYQPRFYDVDNQQFFEDFVASRSDIDWQMGDCLVQHRYLFA